MGRRIQRTPSSGVSTNYIYDGQDVVKDIQSDNSTVEYLNGPGVDDKLRQTSSAGTVYFVQDQLDSTRALIDASGNVVENVNYDSFGNGASSLSRYGYTGREWDGEANLYYYRNRWYDPQVGRFISADPIGLVGGINQYAYVGNNPHSFRDPMGLQAQPHDGPFNPFRNPFSVHRWILNGLSNTFADILDGFGACTAANAGWVMGDYRRSMGERLLSAGDLAAFTGLTAFGGYAMAAEARAAGVVARAEGSGLAGSIRNVNPTGGTANFVNCAVATDAMLAGRPASALPSNATSITELESLYGAQFHPMSSAAEIESVLSSTGPGSRGIIFGSRGTGQVGHVFNGINQRGVIRFLDGQSGGQASFNGYSRFFFMRTN